LLAYQHDFANRTTSLSCHSAAASLPLNSVSAIHFKTPANFYPAG